LERVLSDDPYKVLGVPKNASQDDIQKAYRQLAKKLHPDLNPGNTKAEEQFKEVSAAYDVVGDSTKRARFDRGEIDASGAETPKRDYYRSYAGSGADRYSNAEGFADFADGDDVFAEIFRGANKMRLRGQDAHFRLDLDFLDALNGAKRQVTLPDGSVLDVSIPVGTRDGQILRLRARDCPASTAVRRAMRWRRTVAPAVRSQGRRYPHRADGFGGHGCAGRQDQRSHSFRACDHDGPEMVKHRARPPTQGQRRASP
jgi:DnaJ-class molecular chaperone